MFNRNEYLEFCTVGDLDLLPKFRSCHHYFSCYVTKGKSVGWIALLGTPFNIEWNTQSWETKTLFRVGQVRFTRDLTQDEIDASYESDWA